MPEFAMEIRFDENKLRDLHNLLETIPKALPKVMSRALNRASLTMRSRVSHNAAKGLHVPLRAVKARVHYRHATPAKLIAHVYISDKGFSLWWSKPKQTPLGVVTQKGDRELIRHAFIAILFRARTNAEGILTREGQSHPGVYIRTTRARFPVRHLRTPGIVAAIRRHGGWEKEFALVQDLLDRRMRLETERLLKGGKWSAVESSLSETWAEWRARMGPHEFR